MDFVAENELESTLLAATSSPATRPDFYRALMRSKLYVIDEEGRPEGRHTLQTGTTMRLRSLVIEGVPHVPIFSSLTRLTQFASGQSRYLAISAPDFFPVVASSHLVLNPGSQYSKQFTPHEIGALLDGSLFAPDSREVVQQAREVMLGQPESYPSHLTEALADFFRRRKEVRAAYLGHYFDPQSGTPPHTLIGIDTDGDWDRLVGESTVVLRGCAREGEIVDFIQIDESDLSQYLTGQTTPFYRKKLLGLF